MGLDQYAGFRDSNGEVHEAFYWRKHARLQVFFDQMFTEQNKGDTHKLPDGDGGFGDLSHLGFNGGMGGVKITEEVVNKLERISRGLSELRCRRWFLLGATVPERKY